LATASTLNRVTGSGLPSWAQASGAALARGEEAS
jgi:hypothetical protein